MTSQKNLNFSLTSQTIHTAVLNPQGSKTFLKKIVPASVAFILHQRLESDGKNFVAKSFEGVQYKIFNKVMKNFLFKEVQKWIDGALDALDKNYLRELYLIVAKKDDPYLIYESYKFQFKYFGNDMLSMGKPATDEELKQSTKSLLEAIEGLQQHTKYNQEDVTIKMAISYYEHATPPDYVPPSFTIEEDMGKALTEALGKQPTDYLHLGFLKTNSHILKCRGKGEIFAIHPTASSSDLTDENLDKLEETPGATDVDTEIHSIADSSVTSEEQSEHIQIEDFTETPPTQLLNFVDTSINSSTSKDPEGLTLQCFCDISTKFKEVGEVLCSKCLKLQHCMCVGYLKRNEVPDPYLCPACDDNFPLVQKTQIKDLSIYRLIIGYAYLRDKFPSEIFDTLPYDTKSRLTEKLTKVCFFIEEDGSYKINKDRLKPKFVVKFFKNSATVKQPAPDSLTLESPEKKPEESRTVLGEKRQLNNRTSQDDAKPQQSAAGKGKNKRRRTKYT